MDTTLASRVKFLRESAHIGRKRMSLECSLGASHIGQIERGEVTNPALDTLRAIAARTGVSLGWLATGEGDAPDAGDVAARFVAFALDDEEHTGSALDTIPDNGPLAA